MRIKGQEISGKPFGEKAILEFYNRIESNNGPQIPPGDYLVYEELKKEIQKE